MSTFAANPPVRRAKNAPPHRDQKLDLGAVALITMCATSATAIVVVWKGTNVEVIENATPAFVIEDPAPGTMYKECEVLEWRDADSLGAPDWTPTGTVR